MLKISCYLTNKVRNGDFARSIHDNFTSVLIDLSQSKVVTEEAKLASKDYKGRVYFETATKYVFTVDEKELDNVLDLVKEYTDRVQMDEPVIFIEGKDNGSKKTTDKS